MKSAIIAGSTGFVGQALSNHLVSRGSRVMRLGKRTLSDNEVSRMFGVDQDYLTVPMEHIGSLPRRLHRMGWNSGEDCVFFNLAWDSCGGLTGGKLEQQLSNVSHAAESVKAANEIGCAKYIAAGSYLETVLEKHLGGHGEQVPFQEENYALAKLMARDASRVTAYLERLDYVHTRFSIPLGPGMRTSGYVYSTLQEILLQKTYSEPRNNLIQNFIWIDDLVVGLELAAELGLNKEDYFIAGPYSQSLSGLFENFKLLSGTNAWSKSAVCSNFDSAFPDHELFLYRTGFKSKRCFCDYWNELGL